MRRIGVILLVVWVGVPVFAQTGLRGMSLNGSTGLFSIPSGRIGWERVSDMGLDVGYHALINDEKAAHIPALTFSFFKWVEFSVAFDVQPDMDWRKREAPFASVTQRNDDLLLGLKVQLPTNVRNDRNPAIALGTNVQLINIADNDNGMAGEPVYNYTAIQIYAAATYAGSFFSFPAETTVVMGKTFYGGGPSNNSDIDFGMGFDMVLFPDIIGNYVHWIIDFANFDYNDNSWPNALTHGYGPSWNRGILNTGLRIDMAALPELSKFKLAFDIIFNDLFDDGHRSFTLGMVFGLPIM
ncbi:MAG TPA: hypothetical protein DEQ14_07500 [Treponema sp.]|nr:hypothetical protein [Treponema sp.]